MPTIFVPPKILGVLDANSRKTASKRLGPSCHLDQRDLDRGGRLWKFQYAKLRGALEMHHKRSAELLVSFTLLLARFQPVAVNDTIVVVLVADACDGSSHDGKFRILSPLRWLTSHDLNTHKS
jgi:hypothetical protein